MPFIISKNKKDDSGYRDFLAENEGRRFFVYTNRRKTLKFIEQSIIPIVDSQINIVVLNGRELQTELNHHIIARLINEQWVAGGFPWLITIANNKPFKESLNNKLQQALKSNSPDIVAAVINGG